MHDLEEEDWALLYLGLVEDFMEKVSMAEWILNVILVILSLYTGVLTIPVIFRIAWEAI
jgi:membrane-bound acyltransferase YfiQ involved in biofilm formation